MLSRIVILVVLLSVFLLPGADPFAANVQEAPEFATVDIDRIAVFAAPDELSAFLETQNVSQRFAVTMARVLEQDRGYNTDYVKPNKRHWVCKLPCQGHSSKVEFLAFNRSSICFL